MNATSNALLLFGWTILFVSAAPAQANFQDDFSGGKLTEKWTLATYRQAPTGSTDAPSATTSTLKGSILRSYREVKRPELMIEDGEIRQVGTSLIVNSAEMRAKIHSGFQRGALLG